MPTQFLIARKDRMTQIFGEDGHVSVGTILKAGPITITQVKSKETKDGYSAVQVGFDEVPVKKVNKAQTAKPFRVLTEFLVKNPEAFTVGSKITLDAFSVGDGVHIVGTSKGKGFAGVVKRHGFAGGPRTHGQKHSEREGGSIGGGPGRAGGRVAPGIKMPGRMGGERVTVKNLKVIYINKETGEMIISGAVPGRRGSIVQVMSVPTK